MRSEIPCLGAGRSAGTASSGPCLEGEGCFGSRMWQERQDPRIGVAVLSSRLLHTVLLHEQPVMSKRDETSSVKAGGFVWQVHVMNTFHVWCSVIYHDRYLTYSLTQEHLKWFTAGEKKKQVMLLRALIQMKQPCKSNNAAFGLQCYLWEKWIWTDLLSLFNKRKGLGSYLHTHPSLNQFDTTV